MTCWTTDDKWLLQYHQTSLQSLSSPLVKIYCECNIIHVHACVDHSPGAALQLLDPAVEIGATDVTGGKHWKRLMWKTVMPLPD